MKNKRRKIYENQRIKNLGTLGIVFFRGDNEGVATRTAGAEKRNDFILELYKLAFRENGPDGNGGKDNLYSSLYSKLSSHFFVFLSAEHLFGFCVFIITGVFRFVNPLFTFFILTRHGSRKRDLSRRFLSFFEKYKCFYARPLSAPEFRYCYLSAGEV